MKGLITKSLSRSNITFWLLVLSTLGFKYQPDPVAGLWANRFKPTSPFVVGHFRFGSSRPIATIASTITTTTATTTRSMSSTTSSNNSTDDDVAWEARQAQLFRWTPLVYSPSLSEKCQTNVYLKLDCLQESGSFKDRGMAHLCWTLRYKQNCRKLISSSGGNAGLAVATVGARLGMSVQVVVPTTTKPMVVQKLQSLGAQVTIHGENWNAADALSREWVSQDPEASYISPYDNPLLWTGHSTVINEIVRDLSTFQQHHQQQERQYPSTTTTFRTTNNDNDGTTKASEIPTPPPPAATIGTLILSVGGGGLLCGALEGLERHHHHRQHRQHRHDDVGNDNDEVPPAAETLVIAAETVGASSFGQAWQAGKVVRLSSIDSVATSLGALEVTPAALERATKATTTMGVDVQSALCTDAEAIQACWQFAQDHRILVEPACGAALAVAYSERLRNQYLLGNSNDTNDESTGDQNPQRPRPRGPIVIEVCGGSGVSIDLLTQWKQEFGI